MLGRGPTLVLCSNNIIIMFSLGKNMWGYVFKLYYFFIKANYDAFLRFFPTLIFYFLNVIGVGICKKLPIILQH